MNSIRMRLLVGNGLCLLAVLAVTGALLHTYLHRVLESGFDASLLEMGSVLAKTTELYAGGRLEFEFLEANIAQFMPHENAEYYQVWDRTGKTVGRSPSLEGGSLPAALPLRGSPLFENITLPDGRPGKIVLLNFRPVTDEVGPVPEYAMALAISRVELDRAQRRVLKGLLLSGFFLVLGAFPAVWWSVKRALASLHALGEQTAAIRPDDLSFRFPADNSPAELRPIITRLNSLMGRLEAAFNRERRFTSAAAHELRTPIAELRTLAEVGREEAEASAPAMTGYFEDALGISRHLEMLVTTLLALTRCQAGLLRTEKSPADLAAVIRDAWEGYAAEAGQFGRTVTVETPESLVIETDEGLLRAMLANIFSNAAAYTPPGGEIALCLRMRDGTAVFTVTNTSRGLAPSELGHVFEPFWRKGGERPGEGHCGIGLSLVSAYAQLLGMEADASMPGGEMFRLTLRAG